MNQIASYSKKHSCSLFLVPATVVITVMVVNLCYSSSKPFGLASSKFGVKLNSRIHSNRVFGDDTMSDALFSNASVKSLPQDIINRVEKFVFFIGYPRSGHSIVGSIMDAHPHMIVANEFMLFKKFRNYSMKEEISEIQLLNDKEYLFNALYHSSVVDSRTGWRSGQKVFKNYTLSVDSPWLGRYDGYISVIGDKSGGMTANIYNQSPEEFVAQYEQLRRTVEIPIKVIHCIRNPYDMLATSVIYKIGPKHSAFAASFKLKMSGLNDTEFMNARLDKEHIMDVRLKILENQVGAVAKIINLVGEDNILELHNSELVSNPKSSLTKLCAFLEVDCSAEYIQTCSSKVFKSVSKTRDMVVWPQEVQNRIEKMIKEYPFFDGYSFTGE